MNKLKTNLNVRYSVHLNNGMSYETLTNAHLLSEALLELRMLQLNMWIDNGDSDSGYESNFRIKKLQFKNDYINIEVEEI